MSTTIDHVGGIPVSNILGLSGSAIKSGGGDIPNRLLHLSVPTGYAYTPDEPVHKLQYKSSTTKYTYETVSEDLYNKLIDLVSVKSDKGSRKKRVSISKTDRPKSNKSTRRKVA
jgi:hypothetical protein